MHDTTGHSSLSRRGFTRALTAGAIVMGLAPLGRFGIAAAGATSEQGGIVMSIEKNKAAVRRYFDEVVNAGSASAVADLLAPNFQLHLGSNPPVDAAAVLPLLDGFRGAFPDFRDEVTDMIAEGDRVVAWGQGRGTHRGEFMGIPATGREFAVGWFSLFRLTSDGRIQEIVVAQDQLGMLQQLGVLPPPVQPAAP